MSLLSRTEIPAGMNDDLVRKLALLHDSPPGVAESTIALLGLGARALLASSDPPLIDISDERPVRIEITSAGKKVIEACARAVKAGQYGEEHDVPSEDSWATNHEEKLANAIEAIQSSSKAPTPAGRLRELERDQEIETV